MSTPLQELYLSALQAGDEELAELYLQRLQQPQPMRRPAAAPQPFEPALVTQAEQARQIEAAGEAAAAERGGLLTAEMIEQRRQEAERQAAAALEGSRGRAVQPGGAVVRSDQTLLPPFRPTRIVQVPVFRRVPEELRSTLTPAQIADFETAEPRAGSTLQPIAVERLYQAPGGELRPATRREELVESFAQQTVLSESAAREQAALADEQLAAALRGERLPPFAATLPGLALSALTQRRDEGAGIVETPLQATLRGGAGAGSALAAETIGSAIPAAQTRRAEQVPTALDPELRRRASTDDRFLDRVLENVATGRGVGDEYYDIDVFRETAGDIGAALLGEDARAAAELAPFYVGSVVDAAVPGYIGLVKGAGTAAARAPGVGQALAAGGRQLEGAARSHVARRIISESTLPDAVKGQARTAISGADSSEQGIERALRAVDGVDEAAFTAELQRRTPADYVFVTDTVAVPRGTSAQVRSTAQAAVKASVQRSPAEQAEYLRAIAAAASDTSPAGTQRLNALADTLFPGAAGQAVRTAPLSGATEQTVTALNRAADALERTGSSSAQRSAFRALEQLERDAGMPQQTLRARLVQRAPREVADQLPADLAAAVREAPAWSALSARVREDAFEALRSRAAVDAARGAGAAPRTAAQVNALQAYVRDRNPWLAAVQRVNDGQLTRWVRAVLSKEKLPSASVNRATEQIRASAEQALRTAERQIADIAKQTGSVDVAFERFLERTAPDLSTRQRWEKVTNVLYGERRQKQVLARLERAGILDGPLTVEALKRADAELRRARLVSAIPLSRSPARRALLKVALDEGVRKGALKRGIDLDAALSGELGEVFGAPPPAAGAPRWAALAGAPDPQARSLSRPGSELQRVRVLDRAASESERLLAEGAEELVRFLEDVQPALRGSTLELAKDAAGYLYDVGKAAAHGVKYGFAGIPNLPYITYRLLEAPILSAVTIGARNTLSSIARLGENAVDAAMRALGARHIGGDLVTVDGLRYTRPQLAELAEQYGIGSARTDIERAGVLAKDLERAAIQAAQASGAERALSVVRNIFDPTVKSVYLRTAEALELSYRQAVFEGGIAAGLSPSQAADLARRSQLDFGAQPAIVQNIGRLIGSAQIQYGLLSELTVKAVQNPELFGAAARAMRSRQMAADPYNMDGDRALNRLGVVVGGDDEDALRYYGPRHPLFMPIERALSVVRHGNILLNDIATAAREAPTAPEAGVEIGERFLERGVELSVATLPLVRSLVELSAIEDGAPVPLGTSTDEKRIFWQSALAFRAADPQGDDLWQVWLRIADPKLVMPPAGFAHPDLPEYWLRQPAEGTPHIVVGVDAQNRPLYQVIEPSPVGLQNLAIIRAATPDVLERALGATAALIDAPAGARLPGASIPAGAAPAAVFPGAQAPTGTTAAAAALLGVPGAPADPTQARRRLIEQLRRTREGE